jgi:hypothetical protein
MEHLHLDCTRIPDVGPESTGGGAIPGTVSTLRPSKRRRIGETDRFKEMR